MTTRKEIKVLSRIRKAVNVVNFIVNSSSDARRHYTVQRQGRTWKCSCIGWTRSGGERTGYKRIVCRHIASVKAAA